MLSNLAAYPLTISLTCDSHLLNELTDQLNVKSSIAKILRATDRIKRIVRLISTSSEYQRYFVIIESFANETFEQFVILGLDVKKDEMKIGLVLPIRNDMNLSINGDGTFKLMSSGRLHHFRAVNVRALWTICQDLHQISSQTTRRTRFAPGDKFHEKLFDFYSHSDRRSNPICVNEWNEIDGDLFDDRCSSSHNDEVFHEMISKKIKEILFEVDLNEITSKSVFDRLETSLQMSLSTHKIWIDELMLQLFGQMDRSTMILPHLYLGSEWNASNFDELKSNQIGYILNVSREIENFFPEHFQYLNIRVDDENDSNLLKEWNQTNRFINEAKKNQRACLVHCKMGISRSASTVLAYLMKETDRSLADALQYVKQRRSCINPNEGFRNQLTIYEGILFANKKFQKPNRFDV